jgi:hypothetical protein
MQSLRLPRPVLLGILALGFMLASGGRAQDNGPATPAAMATATNYSTQVLKANELFNQDSLAPALALVQAAIQSEPNRFEGYALQALIFAKQGQAQEARQALATAEQLVPADKKERLTKVQAYVEAHAGAPPVASSAASPEVQRKLNVLKLITDDADKAKSPQERRTLLNEFMDKSAEVLELAPLQTNIWVLRAVAAMELNQATAGWEAGRKLVALGADNSADPKVQKVLAQLDRKGWLTDQEPPKPIPPTAKDFAGEWNLLHNGTYKYSYVPKGGDPWVYTVVAHNLTFAESPSGEPTLVKYEVTIRDSMNLPAGFNGEREIVEHTTTSIYPPGTCTRTREGENPDTSSFSISTKYFPTNGMLEVAIVNSVSYTNLFILALDETKTKLVGIGLGSRSDEEFPYFVPSESQVTAELVSQLIQLDGRSYNSEKSIYLPGQGKTEYLNRPTYAVKVSTR